MGIFGFSHQMNNTNTFGRIPIDQAIDETANKDMQTPGGITGYSLIHNAVTRYYIAADYRRSYMHQLREMVNMDCKSNGHPDLQRSHKNRDERDIQQILDIINGKGKW